MQIVTFRKAMGGMRPDTTIDQGRLTFDLFKQVYGGAALQREEAADYCNVPQGFTLWKTKDGKVLAVQG